MNGWFQPPTPGGHPPLIVELEGIAAGYRLNARAQRFELTAAEIRRLSEVSRSVS